MTYKRIEASREARLWLGQIIIPAASATVAFLTIPEVRQMIATKANQIKYSIENKMLTIVYPMKTIPGKRRAVNNEDLSHCFPFCNL